jgi:ribonuclease Z
MKPLFHPRLVNDPFGDPALYVELLFDRRALLFDLGDLHPLMPRQMLRVTHAFVSHTHMDHFAGFDALVRVLLGREKRLHLFGPPGFLDRVEHKLGAYTWNLVGNYARDFVVLATEAHPGGHAETAEFHTRTGFQREGRQPSPTACLRDGVLVDEDTFRVRAAFLDHQIPCLGFALEEKLHVNVWKTGLEELGLPTGPWLREVKAAIARGEPDGRDFLVRWKEEGAGRERRVPLGLLREKAVRVVPGQKVAYVTDAVYHRENAAAIVELARGADLLFIEAAFDAEEEERAAGKYHLTARQAGLLAREAGVKRLVPFHFSPKHAGDGERLVREALDAFAGL